jgi:YggT family protein
MTSILSILSGLVKLINFLVIIWCVCSWVPNIKWYEQPFKTLDQIVQPIIAPFRKLIPPIGNIDISPMVAMIALQVLASGIEQLVGRF